VVATALDRSTFERLITPSTDGGQRVAGLRFGAPRVMRLLAALGCAGLTFKAFAHTDLRALLIERFGADPAEVTPARLGYQLLKVHRKGLVRRVHRQNRYTVTDLGYRIALSFTKLHQRLLSPTSDGLDAACRDTLTASPHRVDRALVALNDDFDRLAELCGLKIAA
jgi:hypothetical protein